jgi:hypothetical protein
MPGWLVAVLTAILVGIMGWFGKDVFNLEAITDQARKVVPGTGYDKDISYTISDYDDDETAALPAKSQMSPLLKKFLSSGLPADSDPVGDKRMEIRKELSAIGAPPGNQISGLFLTSSRRQPIRVVNIVPVELRRGPVYDGALASIPPQGGAGDLTMAFDFDEPNPHAHSVHDNGTKIDGLFFPKTTIPLTGNSQKPITIRYRIRHGSVSFRLRLDYLLGTQMRHLTIDDEGRPFRLTAYNCIGHNRAAYQQVVQADYTDQSFQPAADPQHIPVDDC